jgi:hypothetical protein
MLQVLRENKSEIPTTPPSMYFVREGFIERDKRKRGEI